MDGIGIQIVVPVVSIIAVAAATFYAVSFAELREKSFREMDEKEDDEKGFQYSMSSRERRARKKANKKSDTST